MPSPRSHIAVFGAGIAGLSAADALVRRGYRVSVYETLGEPGGFFRSAREVDRGNLPSEYSWHGMGPWYHNVFDLLRQIPYDEKGSVYDRGLSRPIDFGIFPHHAAARFFDHRLSKLPRMFRLSGGEFLRAAWLMLKTWTAATRTENDYARRNAAAEWQQCLRSVGARTWRASFGPWIGSDWTNVSLHTAGQFFRQQLISHPTHQHPADDEGGTWSHGATDGWLLLRGPSSEVWFDKWHTHLLHLGVEFHWNARLERFRFDGTLIRGAELNLGAVIADRYILAINPFAAANIIAKTPDLAGQPQLRLFRPLVQDGPHVQVSFRIGFAEAVRFPRARTAVVVADSEFNLTLFAQEQVWAKEVSLGNGIRSLWTVTSCVSTVPGRLYGLPVNQCTKKQFLEEAKAQIMNCGALQALIRQANDGKDLSAFPIVMMEVWHEWKFSPDGIHGPQPKWVNTTHNQACLPDQVTPVRNLLLAGAHTCTEADVWSIEAAVESGRRAARAIDPNVEVIGQYRPRIFQLIAAVDDILYRFGLPHALDVAALTALLAAAGSLIFLYFRFHKPKTHQRPIFGFLRCSHQRANAQPPTIPARGSAGNKAPALDGNTATTSTTIPVEARQTIRTEHRSIPYSFSLAATC